MIKIDGEQFDRLTVTAKREYPEADLTFHVHGWSTYSESSVLAGQQRKVWLNSFDTQEAALKAYPKAVASHLLLEPKVSLDHLPDEDTPVAGGMYPDDIDG